MTPTVSTPRHHCLLGGAGFSSAKQESSYETKEEQLQGDERTEGAQRTWEVSLVSPDGKFLEFRVFVFFLVKTRSADPRPAGFVVSATGPADIWESPLVSLRKPEAVLPPAGRNPAPPPDILDQSLGRVFFITGAHMRKTQITPLIFCVPSSS